MVKKYENITFEDASNMFELNSKEGNLIWKVSNSNRVKIGDIAGHYNKKNKAIVVGINGNTYYAHRIIFLLVTGRWPDGEIDHIDGNRLNNVPSNLRECTRLQNQRNLGISARNKSGVKGVSWDSKRKLWFVCISTGKKTKALGRYNSLEDAAEAYQKASIQFHGEFRRT
jgi:hypothetical protein